MNRNTIIGFILIFGILIGYYLWMAPSQEELEKRIQKQDSLAMVQYKRDSIDIVRELERVAQKEIEQVIQEEATPVQGQATDDFALRQDKYGVFANSASGEEKVYYIENDLIKAGITTLGGKIIYLELKEYQTWDTLPLILIDGDTTVFGLTFFSNNRLLNTNELYFEPYWYSSDWENDHYEVSGDKPFQLGMRLYIDQDEAAVNKDSYIEYLYTFKKDDYMIDFEMKFIGIDRVIDDTRGYIDLVWSTNLRKQEKSIDRFNGSTIYYKVYEDDVDYLSETDEDEEKLKDRIQWASFKQHFFSSTLIADKYFFDPILRIQINENPKSDRYLKSTYIKVGVPYTGEADQNVGMSFYFGPNKYDIMRSYHLDLERQIPLGWSFFLLQWINRYAVLPVFDYLGSFGWNYGIVILVLTLLLKTVLFPIAYKTYMSSAKMRVLKPEVDELAKKFPKKEDSMKKQQATMSLYKKAGVNPMAGCVPMLLQFPILIAMFRFFPASIELRQQSFLWATDLSTYDSIMDLPFEIPFYGDHVSLFTLLMTASTMIYTYLNQQMMTTGTQQMPGMKTMMYLMPLMFLGLFNNYASGLSYYYLVVNVITFAQMGIFRQVVNEDKIHQRIQEQKKKPAKKKSSFQKRLEDAANKRGYKK